MNITITVPDELEARFRKAVKSAFPDIDPTDTLNAKQLAEAATAIYWRRILIDFEEWEAERKAQPVHVSAVTAAREKATTDAAGIA